MQSKHLFTIALVYVAVSVVSFIGFKAAFASGALNSFPGSGSGLSSLISPEVPKAGGSLQVDANAPKTEICPLNGEKYTQAESAGWAKRRPLAVMIENHPDARPQSGLGATDVVYEAVAEGGITRFMGIFYCAAQAKDTIVAPVRSARQYFIDFASDYNFPLYAHVGGANGTDSDPRIRALEHLTDYGWTGYNDMNQFSIGYPVYVRNYNRVPGKELATEHTMESSTDRLWTYASQKRGITNIGKDGQDWMAGFVKWDFQDDASISDRSDTQKISYEFWSGQKDFDVRWEYDKTNNQYNRFLAGIPHIDANDQKQLTAKNVVVLMAKEQSSVDIHKHSYYQTTGAGKALLFQNGKEIDVTWAKKDRTSRLTFMDKKGKPVKFVRGRIWISIVSDQNTVTVQ